MKKIRSIPLTTKTLCVILAVLAIVLAFVMGVSYYAMRQLTFKAEYSVYGRRQSELAEEIRQELLKRPAIEELSFKNSDNMTLNGFLIKRPKAKANLVLCHGYKSSKEFLYGFVDMFPDWNILMFDFRAHGQSEGGMISIGCHEYKDVIAAARFMRPQKGDNNQELPLILLGISMGGASILKAAEMAPMLANVLIIDSTFASLPKTMLKAFSHKSGLPYYPFYPVIKHMFQYVANCDVHAMKPVESVKKIDIPIFFIHSCTDNLTPASNAVLLYANAQNASSRLWIGPRCRHGWLHSYHTDLYKKKVFNFLKKTLPEAL